MYKKVTTILLSFSFLFLFCFSYSSAEDYPKKYSETPKFEDVKKWYDESYDSLKNSHLESVKDKPKYIVSYWSSRYNQFVYVFFNSKPYFSYDNKIRTYRYSGDEYYFKNSFSGKKTFGDIFDNAAQPNTLSIFKIDFKNQSVVINGQDGVLPGDEDDQGGDGKKGNLGDILRNLLEIPIKILKGLEELLSKLLSGLKELLIFLFVPKKEFFDSNYSEMQDILKSKIGIKGITDFFTNLFDYSPTDLPQIKYGDIVFLDFDFLRTHGYFIQNMIAPFLWFYFAIYNLDQIYLLIRGRKLFGKAKSGGEAE